MLLRATAPACVSCLGLATRHLSTQRTTISAAAASNSASQASQAPRFYAQHLPKVIGACVELEPEEAKHAVRVLRLGPDDPVELCDGQGRVVRCIVAHTSKNSAVVSAVEEPQLLPWTGPEWVLAVGCLTLKGGRTDWLVEKATELGARAIVPLITQRSQPAGRNKFKTSAASSSSAAEDFNAGRLERLATAATKQSLRAHTLQLEQPTPVADLITSLQSSPLCLLATASAPPVYQVLGSTQQPPTAWCGQRCYLLVGPEGDFTPEEVDALAAAGALPVGLGQLRLRTETAALALLAAATMYAQQQLPDVGRS